MTPPPGIYHRPADLSQAVDLLRQAEGRAAVLQFSPRPPLEPPAGQEAWIDLASLGLDKIAARPDLFHVGALATLQALVETADLQAYAGGLLPRAARLAAHLGLRQLATLGGALLDPEAPPEIGLALLALDATAVLQGAAPREAPLAGLRPARDEILTEVVFPRLHGAGGALARVARSPLDRASVAAAAVVSARGARVAVAGAGPEPVFKAADGGLDAEKIDAISAAIAAEARPVSDYLGSADYRREMAGVLARRALTEALASAGG